MGESYTVLNLPQIHPQPPQHSCLTASTPPTRSNPGRPSLLLRRRHWRLDVGRQPAETLDEALAGRGTRGHDVPDLVLELGELEGLSDLVGLEGCGGGTVRLACVVEGLEEGWGEGMGSPSGRSCLLAKTRSRLSFISRSLMILCSSCLASLMRARSDESMTKMRPWVPASDVVSPQSSPSPASRPLPSKEPHPSAQGPGGGYPPLK